MPDLPMYLVHFVFEKNSDKNRKLAVKERMTLAVKFYDLAPEGPDISFITSSQHNKESLYFRIFDRIKENIQSGDNLLVCSIDDTLRSFLDKNDKH